MNNQPLLIAILVVLVFGLGIFIGRITDSCGPDYIMNSDMNGAQSQNESTEGTQNTGTTTTADNGTTVITAANLTEGQRKLIQALGIDPNKITVTQEMIVCAETKLGAQRVEEIKNGATPTFSEGASLVVCYNK